MKAAMAMGVSSARYLVVQQLFDTRGAALRKHSSSCSSREGAAAAEVAAEAGTLEAAARILEAVGERRSEAICTRRGYRARLARLRE